MKNFFKNIFKKRKPFGYYLQIDLYDCDYESISNGTIIHNYILTLCELIGMKRYGDTNLMRFGDGDLEGWSFAQMIETSCVSGHFDEQKDNASAYIDIFSCMPFDYEVALNFTLDYFKGNIRRVYKTKRG